ncbi:MAG: apolipoprotein N-acyltransferase, partial [Vulcanimicrobiaceae bacterium]
CLLGFYAADALRRKTIVPLLASYATIAVALILAWVMWPARHAQPPNIEVAAIQGNITQSLKWQPNSLQTAIARYTALTQAAASHHPRMILWPETVITTELNRDPNLIARFGALAHSTHATLVVGSLLANEHGIYNALYIFDVNGALAATYTKRQLVPYAESFPGSSFLSWLPYVGKLNGNFAHGHIDGVYNSGALPFAPLICWESAFADLAHAQIANGAQMLAVSTDDAWFGTSAGPYAHAQIAQLRAVENGTWLLRAASTGISGIIAPTGAYTQRSRLATVAVVVGLIGLPTGSPFARYGPTPVIVLLAFFYAVLVLMPGKRREASRE